MLSKMNMTEMLRNGVCTVTFNKVNGDRRVMNCTLNGRIVPSEDAIRLANLKGPKKPDVIPVIDATNMLSLNIKNVRTPNPNVLNVYATDVGAWRSFRVDSVTSFVNVIGEELCPN